MDETTRYERIIDSRSTVKRQRKEERETKSTVAVHRGEWRVGTGRKGWQESPTVVDTSREKVTIARFDWFDIIWIRRQFEFPTWLALSSGERHFARFSSGMKTGFRFSERSKRRLDTRGRGEKASCSIGKFAKQAAKFSRPIWLYTIRTASIVLESITLVHISTAETHRESPDIYSISAKVCETRMIIRFTLHLEKKARKFDALVHTFYSKIVCAFYNCINSTSVDKQSVKNSHKIPFFKNCHVFRRKYHEG